MVPRILVNLWYRSGVPQVDISMTLGIVQSPTVVTEARGAFRVVVLMRVDQSVLKLGASLAAPH